MALNLQALAHVALNSNRMVETAYLRAAENIFTFVQRGMVGYELTVGNLGGETTGLAYFPLEIAPPASVINTGEDGDLPLPSTTQYTRIGVTPRFYHGQLKATSPSFYLAQQYNKGNKKVLVQGLIQDIKGLAASFGDLAASTFNTGANGFLWQIASATADTPATAGASTSNPLVVTIKTDADYRFRTNLNRVNSQMRVMVTVISTGRLLAAGAGTALIGTITYVDEQNGQIKIVFDSGTNPATSSSVDATTLSELHAISHDRRGVTTSAVSSYEMYGLPDLINTHAFPFGSDEKSLDPATVGSVWKSHVVDAQGSTSFNVLDDLHELMVSSAGVDVISDPFILFASQRAIKKLVQGQDSQKRYLTPATPDQRKGGMQYEYAGVPIHRGSIVNDTTIWGWVPDALATSQNPDGRRGPFPIGRFSSSGNTTMDMSVPDATKAAEYLRWALYGNRSVVNRRNTGVIRNFGA